jgi:hypothetical protein
VGIGSPSNHRTSGRLRTHGDPDGQVGSRPGDFGTKGSQVRILSPRLEALESQRIRGLFLSAVTCAGPVVRHNSIREGGEARATRGTSGSGRAPGDERQPLVSAGASPRRPEVLGALGQDVPSRLLAYAAARHEYRWCSPPTRGPAWTPVAPAGRGSTRRTIGASFSSPRCVRSVR